MADKIFGIIQNNECFEKKAYLSENIMAYKKLLDEEAKKAEETRAREDDLKKELSEFKALLDKQQTVSAEDKKKMYKLESDLAGTKSMLANYASSMQDKFTSFKNAALGDSGLGAIGLQSIGEGIGNGLQSIGGGIGKGLQSIGEGIGKGLASLFSW